MLLLIAFSKPVQCLISSTKRQRSLQAQRTQREGGKWKGSCAIESREQKKKPVAADVSEAEYENADEWNGAGTVRNKGEMRILGRIERHNTEYESEKGERMEK